MDDFFFNCIQLCPNVNLIAINVRCLNLNRMGYHNYKLRQRTVNIQLLNNLCTWCFYSWSFHKLIHSWNLQNIGEFSCS